MDLTGKQIRINSTSIGGLPALTIVNVSVMQDVGSGIKQILGTYELQFEEAYSNPGDPNLLSAITEKLTAL